MRVFLAFFWLPLVAAAPRAVPVIGEVLDAESGNAIPCRLYIQGADGAWHFAASSGGTALEYRKQNGPRSVEHHTTLSAHPFKAELAPGSYTFTVERGKEYLPETRAVAVGEEPVRLTFRLQRWIDAAERGWYSGDTHVHRPLADLPHLLQVEDLNVAFPLHYWVTHAFTAPKSNPKAGPAPDPEAKPIVVDATHVIWPRNTEYEIFSVNRKSHTLGAIFILNHASVFDEGVPPVGPVVRKARAEGALLDLDKHNWPWSMALVPVLGVDLFELANNHHWRTEFRYRDFGEKEAEYMKVERGADGWTERGWTDFGFQNYYALLNCGLRLRPSGGSASGVHPVPLGFGRVYVRVEGEFAYGKWVRGLAEGRSFVSTGPMLFLEGGRPDAASFRVHGSAESAAGVSRIEILVNGEVVRKVEPVSIGTPRKGFENPIDETVPLDGTSWVAVRCFEDRPDGRVRFAHSAPFHVDVPGKPLRPRRAEVEYLVRRVEDQLARSKDVLPEPALEEYREALRFYRGKLEGAR
jgi:hypothetical protein